MAIKLLEIDRPTNTGHIYPRKIVEDAISTWAEKYGKNEMLIFSKVSHVPTMDDVIGVANNLRIEEDYLVADITLIQEKMKEAFPNESGHFCIRPRGDGSVDPETKVIQEGYKIVGLVVRHMPKSTDEKE